MRARGITELMALALQGALLVRHAPAAVADAFCASRLGARWTGAYGTLPAASTSTPSSTAPSRPPDAGKRI